MESTLWNMEGSKQKQSSKNNLKKKQSDKPIAMFRQIAYDKDIYPSVEVCDYLLAQVARHEAYSLTISW
jgi:hypothetical protein